MKNIIFIGALAVTGFLGAMNTPRPRSEIYFHLLDQINILAQGNKYLDCLSLIDAQCNHDPHQKAPYIAFLELCFGERLPQEHQMKMKRENSRLFNSWTSSSQPLASSSQPIGHWDERTKNFFKDLLLLAHSRGESTYDSHQPTLLQEIIARTRNQIRTTQQHIEEQKAEIDKLEAKKEKLVKILES